MDLTRLCDTKLICGEGPVWSSSENKIYFTDSAARCIYSYSESDGCQIHHEGVHAASLTEHVQGGLMISNTDGFFHLQSDAIVRRVADKFNNAPLHAINDIIADPLGRVFAGQECYNEDQAYETGFLYRVDLDGSVSVVDEGLHIANGMGFSPDLNSFYLTDTVLRCIYQFDYKITDGRLSNKRVFLKLSQDKGLPDGLTIDADGFVWTANWFGHTLTRFDPDGKIERELKLPISQPTSLTFGGKDLNEIYITSASIDWRSKLAPVGFDYKHYKGGELYRIKQDIIGKPEFKAFV